MLLKWCKQQMSVQIEIRRNSWLLCVIFVLELLSLGIYEGWNDMRGGSQNVQNFWCLDMNAYMINAWSQMEFRDESLALLSGKVLLFKAFFFFSGSLGVNCKAILERILLIKSYMIYVEAIYDLFLINSINV